MGYFDQLQHEAFQFRKTFDETKASSGVDFDWYPYDTIANLDHLAPLITPEIDGLFAGGHRFADIGAADGALGYFLERNNNHVDFYDYGPTNYNSLRGLRKLSEMLNSQGTIYELDLDSQFQIHSTYDFAMFLGILYHVKNPFYILEQLSQRFKYMAVSTRVVRHFNATSPEMSGYTASYLVGPQESNNDSTNYWMFTDAGLKQLVDRTGWDIVSYRTVGDTQTSNPQDSNRDERAFAILRSKR